jgi:transposase
LQWGKIKDFLPGRKEHVGGTAADNRLFVNGALWTLRSGARWHDLPERYGKYKSVHKRFAHSGVWERFFDALVRDRKNQYLILDSDHRAGSPASGHGTQKRGSDKAVLADKGYDADAIVEHIEAMGAKAVIPPKSNRKQQREYDEDLYKKRNRIERCFSRLKQFRRFATRYDKNRICFQTFVALACSSILLLSIVDTT